MNYTASYWNDIDTVISAIKCKEKLFNRSILITGGSGMICSSVIDILFVLNKRYDAHITIRIAGRNRERIFLLIPLRIISFTVQAMPIRFRLIDIPWKRF